MTTDTETNPLLPRLKMRGLKVHTTAKGTAAWSGTLYLDNKRTMRVSNDGNGGSNMYMPTSPADGSYGKMLELKKAIEAEITEATGIDFEPLDALTACMENGETGAEVIPQVKKEFNRTG